MYKKNIGAISVKITAFSAALIFFAPFVQANDNLLSVKAPLRTKSGSFALKLEPGFAFPLTDPQSRIFNWGGIGTLKTLFSVMPYLDLGTSVTFLSLPSDDSDRNLGTAWAVGGSIQIKRPHDRLYGYKHFYLSPWVDADILYVRTGKLNRPGFALGTGLAMPIGASRIFWLGPFVRYIHIIQPEKPGYDNHDAKIFIFGISLEVGTGVRYAPEPIDTSQVRIVNNETEFCPDRDNDGIPDVVDRCPDVKGIADNWGCPQFNRLIVKSDKIELTERLYFAWDESTIQEVSFPMLDEVVQLLKENSNLRVQVEGHASSEGAVEHNQTLSENRANAVIDYFVAHGIKKERLEAEGFGSSVPADTNATIEGRENNRRVEFIVNLVILNKRSK